MNRIALVTVRNEQPTIARLVKDLKHVVDVVLVVDDASTDQTAFVAQMAGAKVIRQRERLGIGPCLLRGYAEALALGGDTLLQIDAGGSHSATDGHYLLNILERRMVADCIVGSRFIRKAHYRGRPWRALLSRLMGTLCRWAVSGSEGADWTSGLRVFNRRALQTILDHPPTEKMHAFQMAVLGVLWRNNLVVEERPIHYTAGRSSLRWRDAIEASNTLLSLANGLPAPRRVVA